MSISNRLFSLCKHNCHNDTTGCWVSYDIKSAGICMWYRGCKLGFSKTYGLWGCHSRPFALLLVKFWSESWAVGPNASLWMQMCDVFKGGPLPSVTLWCRDRSKQKLHSDSMVCGGMKAMPFWVCYVWAKYKKALWMYNTVSFTNISTIASLSRSDFF